MSRLKISDTLVVDAVAGADEMIASSNIHGAMIYLDAEGRHTGYEDVFTKIEMCRAHYAACGLGADVQQFVRDSEGLFALAQPQRWHVGSA